MTQALVLPVTHWRLVPRLAVLVECLELAGRNLVLLVGAWGGEKGAHVFDERMGYAGWQLDGLVRHGLKIVPLTRKKNGLSRGWAGDRAEAVRTCPFSRTNL